MKNKRILIPILFSTILSIQPVLLTKNAYADEPKPKISTTVDDMTINTSPIDSTTTNGSVNIKQTITNKNASIKSEYNLIVEQVLADGSTRLASTKTIDGNDSADVQKLPLIINTKGSNKGAKVDLRVHFEALDSKVDVDRNEFSTYSFVSSEKVINKDNLSVTDIAQTYKKNGDLSTTERKETCSIDGGSLPNQIRSGYGFPVKLTVNYNSEEVDVVRPNPNYVISAPKSFVSKDVKVNSTTTLDRISFPLIKTNSTDYEFPDTYSEIKSGTIVDKKIAGSNYLDAGRKFYVPMWLPVGLYPITYSSEAPIGANDYKVDISNNLNVFAQMQVTYNSKTIPLDGLNIRPVFPDDFKVSGQWTSEDAKWVRQSIKDDWKGSKYTNKNGNWSKEN